jgi:hypothetical protein
VLGTEVLHLWLREVGVDLGGFLASTGLDLRPFPVTPEMFCPDVRHHFAAHVLELIELDRKETR